MDVTVHGGSSRYKPNATVNGIPMNLVPYQGEWKCTITMSIDGIDTLHFDNGNHVTWDCAIKRTSKPTIDHFEFFGGYPGSQTELKEFDPYQFRVSSDASIVAIEFDDYGVTHAQTITFTATNQYQGVISIANRSLTPTRFGCRVRIKDEFSTYSDWVIISGTNDGVDCLTLNNIKPNIIIGTMQYPSGQSALKNNEVANFNLSITDYSSYNVSTNGELNVSAVSPGNTHVNRVGGDVNVSTNNLTVTAQRSANGSSSSASSCVKIVNVAPTISITSPSRMRSGVSPQNYTITLNSNQPLASAPTLNNTAGTGSFISAFSGSSSVWTRTYQVSDANTKGTFSWASLSATGLSGLITTTISSGSTYTIGGFTMRVITVPAWPTRSAAIGTTVTDTTKLKCTNLSKGSSGSYNYTYQVTSNNAPDSYTILTTNTWYNCDVSNASSNTSSMQIEIEELA